MSHEDVHRGRRDQGQLVSLLLRALPGEMLRQYRNVVLTVPQRGQGDQEQVQPVEQVFAELAVPDTLRQVLVRSADDADVGLLVFRRADGQDLLVLDRPQQLGLQLHGHVADLVEEKRPAVCRPEQPPLVAVGARERSFLVPEQDALEQACADGRTVERLERTLDPAAPAMDLVRDQLLARARLAHHEDIAIGLRRTLDQAVHVLHRLAGADERAEALSGRRRFGGSAWRLSGRLLDHLAQLVRVGWLGQVVLRPRPHRLDHHVNVAQRREHNDRQRGPELLELAEDGQPLALVHLAKLGRHDDVLEDQGYVVAFAQNLQSVRSAFGTDHLVPAQNLTH